MTTTLNLDTQNPRSPKEAWGGVVWLPRMADKARAAKAGTLGEFMYPCPMDKIMLQFLKLEANEFSALANQQSDDALARWIENHLKEISPKEIETANNALLSKQPDSPEKWARFEKTRDELAPDRKDINTWAALIDLEEGHA